MKKIVPHSDPPEEYIRLAEKLGPDYFVADMGQVPAVYRKFENGNEAAITVISASKDKFSIILHIWRGVSAIAGNRDFFGRNSTAVTVTSDELKAVLERAYNKYGRREI